MTILTSDNKISTEKLFQIMTDLSQIGMVTIHKATLRLMREEIQTLREELAEHGDFAECERCSQFTEIVAHDMCDCCAHDMGAIK